MENINRQKLALKKSLMELSDEKLLNGLHEDIEDQSLLGFARDDNELYPRLNDIIFKVWVAQTYPRSRSEDYKRLLNLDELYREMKYLRSIEYLLDDQTRYNVNDMLDSDQGKILETVSRYLPSINIDQKKLLEQARDVPLEFEDVYENIILILTDKYFRGYEPSFDEPEKIYVPKEIKY